jgi:hypothetical protein
MKTTILAASVMLSAMLSTTAARAGLFASSVERYRASVVAAHAVTAHSNTMEYLSVCLRASGPLRGIEVGDTRLPERLRAFLQARRVAKAQLQGNAADERAQKAEDDAYALSFVPYVSDQLCWLESLQDELRERKYFRSETEEDASSLEAYAKRHYSLMRTDVTAGLSTRNLGISPWEAMFRVEPTLAFDNGPQAALLGTVGLSYTFFPGLDLLQTPPTFDESLLSKYLQKSGVRLGAGPGQFDGQRIRLLLGAGIQVNAIAIWALYQPVDEKFMLAVSASDLSKLKDVMGWIK